MPKLPSVPGTTPAIWTGSPPPRAAPGDFQFPGGHFRPPGHAAEPASGGDPLRGQKTAIIIDAG
jgi:hypothetical protein